MGFEYEWKFRVDRDKLAAVLAAVPGELHQIAMQTTYYDTPAGELSALRCTLRTRLENGTCVCTLKTPAKGVGRSEWELVCPRVQEAIDHFCRLQLPEQLPGLLKKDLVPVCGARFQRITKTHAADGCTLELAFDEGVLLGGGRELPFCEIEVELKSGSRESCDRYAAALARQFDLPQETKSKFRRALELSKGDSL